MATATLADGTIRVVAPYAVGMRLRAIPSARWDRLARAWLLPATPTTARAVRAVLAPESPSLEVELLAAQGVAPARETPIDHGSPIPPWQHQVRGAHWLADHPGALLRYGLGTGKTRAALDALIEAGATRALVVAPNSVLAGWRTQCERHYPGEKFRVLVLDNNAGSVRTKTAATRHAIEFQARRGQTLIVAINYESLWREPFASLALSLSWDAVIYDEIHRIKSPGSKCSLFAARLQRKASRSWGLSGTPLAHSPLDAYGVCRALDPGVFGTSFVAFRSRYAVMGGFQGRQVVAYCNVEDFRERLYAIMLDADRSVLDLPSAHHADVAVTLSAEALRVYRDLATQFVAELSGGETISEAHALTRMLRLQQITSGYLPLDDDQPARVICTAKRDALADLLDSLDASEPVVVFGRFVHDLASIHAAAAAVGRTCLELSGRRRELGQWQQASGGEVLAVQVQSGSEGIDLTRAAHCVFYSLSHSLAQFDQALARVHRPGQERPVTYYHLIAERTIDRRIYRALSARREVIRDILENRTIDD